MNFMSFWGYDKKAEETDYKEFANIDIDDLMKQLKQKGYIEIWPHNLIKIAKSIKDTEIKNGFINKVKELYKDERYQEKYDYIESLEEEVFSQDEIKWFIESEIKKREAKYAIPIISKVKISDIQWLERKIDEILNVDKDCIDIGFDRLKLILSIDNKEIKKRLLKKYANILPPEYKKYIEIKANPDYIIRKARKFKNFKIGINPKISIGAEIEANCKYSIINVGFTLKDKIGIEGYKKNVEVTVEGGSEISTPIFHDKSEELALFCAMCETMKEQGFYYDEEKEKASGQINLGIDYLDSSRSIINFIEIFGNCEELLYHITNKEGQQIRQGISKNLWFNTVSKRIGTRIVDEDIDREDLIQLLTAEHDSIYRKDKEHIRELSRKKDSICLRDGNRFEIRIPNGTTDYEVWIDNIRLFGKIMEVSKKCADILKKDELTQEEMHLLDLKEELSDSRNSLEYKLYMLMDLLFDDEKIKQIYIKRFKTLENIIKNTDSKKYEKSDANFGVVDFQQKNNPDGKLVVLYDPSEEER